MKSFYPCLLLVILIITSCQKDKGTPNSVTGTSNQPTTVNAPSAEFKISNSISSGSVWELLTLNFTNESKNADSYYWDFGNGITSTDKIPSNISLAPCGFTYTVSLTVKNKNGVSSTYATPIFVVCSRGMGFGAHGK
jgi:PKD repeat protein